MLRPLTSLSIGTMIVSVAAGSLLCAASPAQAGHILIKQDTIETANITEVTPVVFQGQQLLFESYRVGVSTDEANTFLRLRNLETGQIVSQFGAGHSLGSAFVDGNQLNVFAPNLTQNDWFHDIYRFTSTDLASWTENVALTRSGGEHLLNSSVIRDPHGYLMAYESDVPVGFCFKFARSTDLATWTKLDAPAFAGPRGNEYSACPTIRYSNDYYYALYLAVGENQYAGQYVTEIARSKDLVAWEFSEQNPVLAATAEEGGINNSDVDMIEVGGKTYLYYATGNQATWVHIKRAVYDAPMSEFLASYFPAAVPEPGTWAMLSTAMFAAMAHAWRRRR